METLDAAQPATPVGPWKRLFQRRIPRRRLRFTREGRYFVGLTLGVGFAAINTGNNLLYLVLGMMLSLIVVSGILSELALKGLAIERSLPPVVHARTPYLTGIGVRNEKQRLASFSVQVEDLIDGHPLAKKCYFLKLPPHAHQSTSYRSEFRLRGRYVYRGFHLSTRFPFAFFIKTYRVDAPDELIVLPHIHPVAELPVEARALLGTEARARRGVGREFHGLRTYRDGDDARDIHWKRSAREGRLVLREYEADAGRRVGIVLNDQLAGPPSTELAAALERAVDLAASLATHLEQRGFLVDLRLGGQTYEIEPGGRGLSAALRALALHSFVPHGPAAGGPETARRIPWVLVQAEGQPAAGPGFTHILTAGAA